MPLPRKLPDDVQRLVDSARALIETMQTANDASDGEFPPIVWRAVGNLEAKIEALGRAE